MKSSYGTEKYYEEQVAIAATREVLIREAIRTRVERTGCVHSESDEGGFNVDDMAIYAEVLDDAKHSVEYAKKEQMKFLNEQKRKEGGDNE